MRGESWGRYPSPQNQEIAPYRYRTSRPELPANGRTVLPFGQGRSYGDACLNDGGVLLETSGLDRLIAFDQETGLIEAEAGITLEALLAFIVPRGWFIPVSPGTQFVSLGGAIANDVHGKNHHRAGTFGCHVRSFQLLRSNGEQITCSPNENHQLFQATIAGLGLTGFILSAELQLIQIESPYIDMQSIKFSNLDQFFELASGSDATHDYTVAWLDCINQSPHRGRGIFMRGNHSKAISTDKPSGGVSLGSLLQVPFDFPSFALNKYSLSLFNHLYYNKQLSERVDTRVHYRPFFYPLDSVHHWNRIYGKRGFLQFQCVVPTADDNVAIRKVLDRVFDYGKASFLAVIKEFGDIPSPGMLSFPRPGITLCLDFANSGEKTMQLFRDLEETVLAANGALYPAKDACMRKESFQTFYPQWKDFSEFIDPNFSSSFWRRVTE